MSYVDRLLAMARAPGPRRAAARVEPDGGGGIEQHEVIEVGPTGEPAAAVSPSRTAGVAAPAASRPAPAPAPAPRAVTASPAAAPAPPRAATVRTDDDAAAPPRAAPGLAALREVFHWVAAAPAPAAAPASPIGPPRATVAAPLASRAAGPHRTEAVPAPAPPSFAPRGAADPTGRRTAAPSATIGVPTASAHDAGASDELTISIGAIDVTIENPPAAAPPRRPEPPARPAPPPRLRRSTALARRIPRGS